MDFSTAIPPELKVKPGKNRYLFKQAMQGFLPEAIIRKEKHGFGLPVAPWLRSVPQLRELLQDTVFAPHPRLSAFIRGSFLKELKQQAAAVDDV